MVLAPIKNTTTSDREVSIQISRLMNLLRQFAGFRTSNAVQRKLEKIFSQMPPADLSRWMQEVESDAHRTDLVALVEDLTNHETYFFREKVQLDVFSQNILPELIAEKLKKSGPKKIILWSAACSSGEEAYTLAMLALEAMASLGVAQEVKPGEYVLAAEWSLQVMGTDISRQAIRLANESIYSARNDGLSSFRNFPKKYLRFFDEVSEMKNARASNSQYFRIKPVLTRYVSFKMFNLMSKVPCVFDADVIFCRNVLIYIETEIQKNMVAMLAQSLRPGGTLVLGLVDTPETAPHFSKYVLSPCVVYRKINYAR